MGLYETLYGVPKPRKRSNLENMYMDSERQRAQASAPGLHGIAAPNKAQSSGLDTVNAYKARGGIGKNESTLDDDYAKWQQAAADKQLNGTDKYKDYYDSITNAYTDSQKEKSNLEKLYDSTNSNLQNAYDTNKNALDNQRRSQQQGVHNMTALQRLYEGQRLEKLGIANGSAQTSSDIRMRNSMLSNLGGINQSYGNRLDSYNTAHSNSMNDLNTQYNASLDGIQKKSSSLRDKYMEAYKANRTNDTYADYAGKVNSSSDLDGLLKNIGAEKDYLTAEQRSALENTIGGMKAHRVYDEVMAELRKDNADIDGVKTKYSLNKNYLSAEEQNAYTEAFHFAEDNKKTKDAADKIYSDLDKVQQSSNGGVISYDKYLEIQKQIENDNTMSARAKIALQERINKKGYNFEGKDVYDKRQFAKPESYANRGALANVADTSINRYQKIYKEDGWDALGAVILNSAAEGNHTNSVTIGDKSYNFEKSGGGYKPYNKWLQKNAPDSIKNAIKGDVIEWEGLKYVLDYDGKWNKLIPKG